jgi:hypothetical protein
MKFVRFTVNATGGDIFVNPRHVTSFVAAEIGGTIIRFVDGNSVKVKEAPTKVRTSLVMASGA